jgi:hypothetical protein
MTWPDISEPYTHTVAGSLNTASASDMPNERRVYQNPVMTSQCHPHRHTHIGVVTNYPTSQGILLLLRRLVADEPDMQPALVHNRPTATEHTSTAGGTLVRRSAITAGFIYSTLIVILFANAPELRTFTVVWFLWILVIAGAAATYAAGNWMRRTQRREPG